MTALDQTPIKAWLNYAQKQEGERLIHHMTFAEHHIGNPLIRAIHGGVVSAFFELSAQEAARHVAGVNAMIGTVSANIGYLTSTTASDLFAQTSIKKQGRRLIFVMVQGWQKDQDRLVATAEVCLRVITPKEKDPVGSS